MRWFTFDLYSFVGNNLTIAKQIDFSQETRSLNVVGTTVEDLYRGFRVGVKGIWERIAIGSLPTSECLNRHLTEMHTIKALDAFSIRSFLWKIDEYPLKLKRYTLANDGRSMVAYAKINVGDNILRFEWACNVDARVEVLYTTHSTCTTTHCNAQCSLHY